MLKRDFSKNNLAYFNKNKITLIVLALILIVGLIMGCTLGFNNNFELAGYQEFSVNISEENQSKIGDYVEDIKDILEVYDADYDSYQIAGQGDNTKIVIRYMSKLSETNITRVNNAVAEDLDVELIAISSHESVGSVVRASDFIYTAMIILLITAIASIFAYIRYNSASAVSIIIANIISTLLFLSASIIFRLKVAMSYFSMLIILNALVIYSSLIMFEHIKNGSWLHNKDFENAILDGRKSGFLRNSLIAVAMLLVGVAFVIFAPAPVKAISLNIVYMAVVYLFATQYIVPFVWNVCITRSKLKGPKKEKK